MKKQVHVAVGVVYRKSENQTQILIAKRHIDQHQGGLWEFPGGKVETGESCLCALQREFLEEVNIAILDAKPLIDLHHDYQDKSVRLETLITDSFNGEAKGLEGQEVRWVDINELDNYAFPQANIAILGALKKVIC